MKPRKIRGELKDLIAQDLAANKPRKQICQERHVTYQQISQEFGHVWKRGPAIEVKEEASTN